MRNWKIYSFSLMLFTFCISLYSEKTYVFHFSSITSKENVKYGDYLIVKFDEVNKLDYQYSIKIESEQPKPQFTQPIPGTFPVIALSDTNTKNIINKYNELLFNRAKCFRG